MSIPNSLYSPFYYTGTGSNSTNNGLQGIKRVPGTQKDYVLTGTSGNISTAGQGTVYVGPINGSSTANGSGSGDWLLMNVPSSWNSPASSIYGPGLIQTSPTKRGLQKIRSIQLAGTYTTQFQDTSNYNTIGFTYQGPLTSTPTDTNFTSFRAKTPEGATAYDTFLHSWSGDLVAGNYTRENSAIALTINSGIDSSAFVYNPKTQTQRNLRFTDGSTSHTAFGIWFNGRTSASSKRKAYTIAGGSTVVNPAVNKIIAPSAFQIGAGMLVDYDPVTGQTHNQRNYQYQNDKNNVYVTHFEGIYKAADNIYQMPFVAASSNGLFAGNAYVKRLSNGQFSKNALWQTFSSSSGGSFLSNDSTAGPGSVGLFNNGAVVPFAGEMTTQAYNQLLSSAQALS